MTRLTIPIALRWGDQDAYGHVNNATMFRLLEEARVRAFIIDEAGGEASPVAALRAGPDAELWTLIAGQQIQYLRPVEYVRDPLLVEMWIGRIGGASLDICYEVQSPAASTDRVVFARALSTLVTVDAATGRPVRIPTEMRELWEPYVEPPVEFPQRG